MVGSAIFNLDASVLSKSVTILINVIPHSWHVSMLE